MKFFYGKIRGLEDIRTFNTSLIFETFVDIHSSIFEEYLSSVIAKLSKKTSKYKAIEERIEQIYCSYSKVVAVLDTESACVLNE